jgi:hypothetical protein
MIGYSFEWCLFAFWFYENFGFRISDFEFCFSASSSALRIRQKE